MESLMGTESLAPSSRRLAAQVAKFFAKHDCRALVLAGAERFVKNRRAGESGEAFDDYVAAARKHFEQDAFDGDSLLEFDALPVDWVACVKYKRNLTADELDKLPSRLRPFAVDFRRAIKDGLSVDSDVAGRLQIVAPAPASLSPEHRPDLFPKILAGRDRPQRDPTFEELCFAFAGLNDAADNPPVVPETHPLRHGSLYLVTFVAFSDEATGEWLKGVWPTFKKLLLRARESSGSGVRKKRSTQPGEARLKLKAALTQHHQYEDGGCLNFEPIANNELARHADVDRSTASAFFKREFGSHSRYKTSCRSNRIIDKLKVWNEGFAVEELYGATPPGEREKRGE